ncbi:MAG: bifunctional phosphopantothenoylcysteine decarboxylase/phosphopantothenate--cysteine ligase CoaBC [Methylococcales bacterium]|nr:bifunctional phosphopantothenoylcysteine decarboxylase/phosphopantothenate--cysteine ligase CoaBC [Methylococcales bacterium]
MKKRILLAISGGIAAYKCAELVRLLVKQNAEVRIVMTQAALQFVTPLTFQALSGYPVQTDLLTPEADYAMGHIELARWADVLLIAPATANVLAKLSHGLADDLLSTLYLVAECPVYVAPAMNQAMWHKPVTQQNLKRLQQHGVILIGPESGEQACGDIGFGRMSEPTSICQQIMSESCSRILLGKKILITAGPTREAIDPVRYITNRSSGKMGYALAAAAVAAGAEVTLVSGPVALTAPPAAHTLNVETAAQMYATVMQQVQHCDIFIAAAAVADYTPQEGQPSKIKKQAEQTTLILLKTQDILAAVAALPNAPFSVGFAAETDDLEKHALDKLQRKRVNMIAANWVGREQGGFESDQNALQVFWKNGQHAIAMMDKAQLAEQLIHLIAAQFHKE